MAEATYHNIVGPMTEHIREIQKLLFALGLTTFDAIKHLPSPTFHGGNEVDYAVRPRESGTAMGYQHEHVRGTGEGRCPDAFALLMDHLRLLFEKQCDCLGVAWGNIRVAFFPVRRGTVDDAVGGMEINGELTRACGYSAR